MVSHDRINVWAPGADGTIWHRWWDGSDWVEWELAGDETRYQGPSV